MAVLFSILQEIQRQISALELAGLSPANIVIQKAAATRVKDLPEERYPCIIVAPFGAEANAPVTNYQEDVTYPVLVAICASEKDEQELPVEEQEQRLNMYLQWRETIRLSLSNDRLTSTLCHVVRAQPLPIVDRDAWFERGLWVSGMILQCTQRETRL